MTRVILETDVHCTDCAKKIRKAVQSLPGVQKVQASPETGLVVVTGTADAGALRRRIERKLDRPVDVVSDGAAPEPVDRSVPAGWSANRWAAPTESFSQPYGGGRAMPRALPHLYGAPQLAYPPYAGMNQWAMPAHRHVSHGMPARLDDDQEGLESCCSIQ